MCEYITTTQTDTSNQKNATPTEHELHMKTCEEQITPANNPNNSGVLKNNYIREIMKILVVFLDF